MAAAPFHVLSENPDGSPFLIVGAGISPANADIVFTSRDSAGSYGPLPEYVAKALGITVSDIWAEGKPGDFGVAHPFGRTIAHLTSVDGIMKAVKNFERLAKRARSMMYPIRLFATRISASRESRNASRRSVPRTPGTPSASCKRTLMSGPC